MRIESLKLSDFRNYENLELELCPGTNLFYGDNAQGKTNILEGVYLCGTTRSHRSTRDRDMIRFGQEEAHLRMEIVSRDIPYRIDMHLRKNRAKGIAVNGVPIRRAGELMGLCRFVFFSPEDLNLIKNGPAERRRFLDMELCQLESVYVPALTGYTRALTQRNTLLKNLPPHPTAQDSAMLDVWDAQLVSYGCKVIASRQAFAQTLNTKTGPIHRRISGGREELTVLYEPDSPAERFEEELFAGRERDLYLRTTNRGPHRDDLCLRVNGIDLRRFGSQGQQRSAALSLKLSEIELVKEKAGDSPVLLLDDVLSELDERRERDLLESITETQTLITCTGVQEFEKNHFRIDRLFRVAGGTAEIATEE